MDQRVSLITLGVADVARARRFYEALGWQCQEVEETVFVQAGGSAIVLWDREKLADDAGVEATGDGGFSGIALAQNVRSPQEVDAIMASAKAAGATVTKAAAKTFYGGYGGYFADSTATCGSRPQPELHPDRRRLIDPARLLRRVGGRFRTGCGAGTEAGAHAGCAG